MRYIVGLLEEEALLGRRLHVGSSGWLIALSGNLSCRSLCRLFAARLPCYQLRNCDEGRSVSAEPSALASSLDDHVVPERSTEVPCGATLCRRIGNAEPRRRRWSSSDHCARASRRYCPMKFGRYRSVGRRPHARTPHVCGEGAISQPSGPILINDGKNRYGAMHRCARRERRDGRATGPKIKGLLPTLSRHLKPGSRRPKAAVQLLKFYASGTWKHAEHARSCPLDRAVEASRNDRRARLDDGEPVPGER